MRTPTRATTRRRYTLARVADSLTKVKDAEALYKFMMKRVFGMKPTPENLAINAKSRLYRKQTGF